MKRPGAISTPLEPQLIFINMLPRPPNTVRKEIFSLVSKTNEIIKQTIAMDRNSHFLQLTSVNKFIHFDSFGRITAAGYNALWLEISNQLADFERGKTTLRPLEQTTSKSDGDYHNSTSSSNSKNNHDRNTA